MFPHIYETVYGDGVSDSLFTQRDAKLNSMLLRHVVQGVFTGDNDGGDEPQWRVRVEDRHDSEQEPHYVLDFGNVSIDHGVDAIVEKHKIITDYCDNHSDGRTIVQEVGRVTVTVWSGYGTESTFEACSGIRVFYCHEALPECFPDYFINIFRYSVERPERDSLPTTGVFEV